jgi:hypothetical protein
MYGLEHDGCAGATKALPHTYYVSESSKPPPARLQYTTCPLWSVIHLLLLLSPVTAPVLGEHRLAAMTSDQRLKPAAAPHLVEADFWVLHVHQLGVGCHAQKLGWVLAVEAKHRLQDRSKRCTHIHTWYGVRCYNKAQ